MKPKEGKDCIVTECPQCTLGKCDLSKLDINNNWYTDPNKCTHYKWKTQRKGQK